MESRGVTFRLNTRVTDANLSGVVLSDGEIHTQTLVWTAGTAPNPILKVTSSRKRQARRPRSGEHTRVPGHPGLWALGDCAAVIDAKTSKPCPPHRPIRSAGSGSRCEEHLAALQGRSKQKISFRLSGSALRRRTSDRMCRTDGSVREKPVPAFFGIVCLADVARNLSFETPRAGKKDSRTCGLDDRTLLSARYRSNDRLAVMKN